MHNEILNKLAAYQPYTVTRRVDEQLNLTLNDVKFTFFEYPYTIEANCRFENIVKDDMPIITECPYCKSSNITPF